VQNSRKNWESNHDDPVSQGTTSAEGAGVSRRKWYGEGGRLRLPAGKAGFFSTQKSIKRYKNRGKKAAKECLTEEERLMGNGLVLHDLFSPRKGGSKIEGNLGVPPRKGEKNARRGPDRKGKEGKHQSPLKGGWGGKGCFWFFRSKRES